MNRFLTFLKNLFGPKSEPAPHVDSPIGHTGIFRPVTTLDNKAVDLFKFFGEESPEQWGYRQARQRGGALFDFKIYLNRIYNWYSEERRMTSEGLSQGTQAKIDELNSVNQDIQKRIRRIEGNVSEDPLKKAAPEGADPSTDMPFDGVETIPSKENRIRQVKKEIQDIKENPKGSRHIEDYDDDRNHQLVYWIALIGMIVIISFLWIFYSSVIYSALWRQFKPGTNLVLESILYPRAVQEAFQDDALIGFGVCLLPFVFALLAFVFEYYFSRKKFFIAVPLLIFAFLMDSYLAYKITGEIYQITHTTFEGVAEYKISLAIQDINYWLIIGLGFGLYLFLGFVYHIFDDSLKNLNKVRRAIQKRVDTIGEIEHDIALLRGEVSRYQDSIDENKRRITTLKNSLKSYYFPWPEFQGITDGFVSGWIRYLGNTNELLKQHCESHYGQWLDTLNKSLPNVGDVA